MDNISPYISDIEDQKEIKIIYASNTGSQAWGLESPESDYDIKFVFSNKPSDYATFDEETDICGTGKELNPYDTNIGPSKIDFSGWDIRKFSKLIEDDNPAAVEALCSPLKYVSNKHLEELEEYYRSHFNVINMYNHYRGMAKSNYLDNVKDKDSFKPKRLLYVVRAALYAQYIKEKQELPNYNFPEFVRNNPLEGWNKEDVEEVIKAKKSSSNSFSEVLCEDSIQEVIEDKIEESDYSDSASRAICIRCTNSPAIAT